MFKTYRLYTRKAQANGLAREMRLA